MLCLAISLTDLKTGESKPDVRIPFAALSHISRFIPDVIQQQLLANDVDVDALVELAKSKVSPCVLVDVTEQDMRLYIAVKPMIQIGQQSQLPDKL